MLGKGPSVEDEPVVEKVEFKKAKPLPAGLLKRLKARKERLGQSNSSNQEESVEPSIPTSPPPVIPKNLPDLAIAEKAAQAAMASMDFSSTSLDVKYLQSLFASAGGSKPPGLKPGQRPIKTDDGAGDHINMPSENPISIPGLPAGWKFGDVMPQGTPRPSDEPEEEDQKNLLPLDIATSRKRKRRPEQPVIFQVWTVPSFSPSLSRFRCIVNRDHMVALMSLTTVFRRMRLVH